MVDDPRIILNADGTIAEANEAALTLYRLTLPELRAAPAGAFAADPQSDEERDAFRAAWESSGRPDLVGSATLRRLDQTTVRVRFVLAPRMDGSFVAVLRPSEEQVEGPPVIFTAGEVLARWRAAERELEDLTPEAPERSLVEREIERFREAYQQFFLTRGDSSPA